LWSPSDACLSSTPVASAVSPISLLPSTDTSNQCARWLGRTVDRGMLLRYAAQPSTCSLETCTLAASRCTRLAVRNRGFVAPSGLVRDSAHGRRVDAGDRGTGRGR